MKPNQKKFLSKFELGLEVWVRVCESECVSGSVGRKGLIFNKEKKIFLWVLSLSVFFFFYPLTSTFIRRSLFLLSFLSNLHLFSFVDLTNTL